MKTMIAALAIALGAGAAASDAAAVPGVSPGIVDARAARELVAAGVKVVDVRTPAEFDAGHVPGAVNIPFDEIAKRTAVVGPPSTPVLLYCKSGRRSGIAGETLKKMGFTKLYDLQSYDRWTASEPGSATK